MYIGFSINYMYTYENNKCKRTRAYNNWINNFPTDKIMLPIEYFLYQDIDFTKPIVIHIKYVAKLESDIENFNKSFIDMIFNRILNIDDNIVQKVISERIGVCETYEDGQISFAIGNI